MRAASRGQFSGTARPRPQVVITRIAVRHEHHLAPRLVEQGSRRRQGRARRRPPPTPAVNVEPPADDHGEDEKSEDLVGKGTTIWRPNLDRLYASVAEMEGSESEEEEKDATKKGVKRKRAPPTKGPCEHGVKPRSRCKVCGGCPHGKWRHYCKEVAGHQSASTAAGALSARSAVGAQSASTAVSALSARSAVVHQSASTVVSALSARSAVGTAVGAVQGVRWVWSICKHGRQRNMCKECGGASICEHGLVSALSARSAAGHQCEHGRERELSGGWGINLRARSSALSVQGVQEIAQLNRDDNNDTDTDTREARVHA